MGDRANVRILQSSGQTRRAGDQPQAVFLYTHWGGSELAYVLQEALKRKERWDDEVYLARIIFAEMTKGQEKTETGYGIATSICDNEHQILTVDCKAQYIRIGPAGHDPIHRIPFKDFIEMSEEELDKVYLGSEEEDG